MITADIAVEITPQVEKHSATNNFLDRQTLAGISLLSELSSDASKVVANVLLGHCCASGAFIYDST
jgi:hypothetical protein